MPVDPDNDVATKLQTAGLGTLATDIFAGPVRPAEVGKIPHAAIFCLATGGPPPQAYLKGPTPPSFRQARVQVRIRSNAEAFGAGQTKARAVRDALHLAVVTGYVAIYVQETEPIYLGQDDLEHHEWAVNLMLWFEQ